MQSVAELGPNIAPWIGSSGTCPDNTDTILKGINDIRSMLWAATDFPDIMEWVDICCVQGCFYLPPRYEVARNAKVCGRPLKLQNEWWQTVVPDSKFPFFPLQDVVADTGRPNCKFREYTAAPYYIELYPESNQDEGVEFQFEARDSFSRWEKVTLTAGEAFVYVPSDRQYVTFQTVTKPATKGGFRVYAHDTTNSVRQLLAIYQPWETNPQYRRYSIPNCRSEVVSVRCKRRYYPLTSQLDLVEFPLEAMIQGAMAITYRKDRDFVNYKQAESEAIGELMQHMESDETRGSTPIKVQTDATTYPLVGGYWNGW